MNTLNIARHLERKKAARSHIAEHALSLASEHGIASVTVDDIAQSAGISRRTFFNYFPSKLAAMIPESLIIDEDTIEKFVTNNKHSTAETICDLLCSYIEDQFASGNKFTLFMNLAREETSLQTEITSCLLRSEHDLAALICARENWDPQSTEGRMVAAVAISVVRVCLFSWTEGGQARDLAVDIRENFQHVGEPLIESLRAQDHQLTPTR